MSDQLHNQHAEVHNEQVRYERRDVRLRPLLAAAAALAALVVGAGLGSAGLFRLFAEQSQCTGPNITAPATLETAQQSQVLRVKEETLLNEYAWVDKEAGIVRIPIDRAMELIAAQAEEDTDDE